MNQLERKWKSEVDIENVRAYNSLLYNDVFQIIQHHETTIKLMRITLTRQRDSMDNRRNLENKKRFFEICLQNV